MNFSEIQTEVQDTLARTDSVVTAKIPTWVNRRQRVAASRHNFGFMQTEATVAIAADPASQQNYSLPSDFKDEVVFMLHQTAEFTEVPIKGRLEMIRTFGPTDTGEPEFVTFEPGTGYFRVWPPIPDAAYTVRVVYFAWPADLSGTGTNWLTDYFPGLLIAGGVAEGLRFLGAYDEAQWWDAGASVQPGREANPAAYESMLRQAVKADTERRMPTPAILVPRLDVHSPGLTPRRRDGWPF